MKKKIALKKITTSILATTIALSIVSCGGTTEEVSDGTQTSSEATETTEIIKPEKINAYIDTVFSSQIDPTSWQPWVDKYKELTGIEISFTKPVHSEYYQQLSLAFTTGEIPDAMEIGSYYYPTYANNGALWDMTDTWENSELKASGLVDESFVENVKINDVLYGFPMTRGNGTVTYVRKDWLDNLGIDVPTNYDEFIAMLDAFTYDDPDGNGIDDTYGITMPGLIGVGTPYDLYQREFYQDAQPQFYQKEDGTWVDGMTEPEMVDALQRMKDAYSAGYIDQEVITNKTSTSRDKFYGGQVGVFNYWAGTWNKTLQDNLAAQNPEGIVMAIPAIEETHYIERPSTVFAITSAAENPEGIFKYLIEYSHDGGEGQMLFTRGVEGVNYTVENGVYTQLPDVENPKKLYEKAWYDSPLSITTFDDPIATDEIITNSLEIFSDSAELAPVPPMNDTLTQYQADLNAIRDLAIANAVTTDMSVEDALAQYSRDGEQQITAILDSLNN